MAQGHPGRRADARVTDTEAGRLTSALASSALLVAVLQRWSDIALPNVWLAAGAVAQTVWNIAHRRAPEADLRDIDLVYFDGDDLSAEAELRNEARIRELFGNLGVTVDVKNEAGYISGMRRSSAVRFRHTGRSKRRSRHSPPPPPRLGSDRTDHGLRFTPRSAWTICSDWWCAPTRRRSRRRSTRQRSRAGAHAGPT